MSEPLPDRRCVVCHTTYAGGERFCSRDGGAIVATTGSGPDEYIGRTLDERYLVRRLIGRGGMGAVYEADHVGLDRRVAIKFLLGDRTNKDVLARFRREARAASKVVHEHVVQIFDVGTDDSGIDFIVMELLDGRDLKKVLAEDGRFSADRAIAVGKQILRGLHAIHEGGILHRDIKPANILMADRASDRDFVKIMDFGISKVTEGAAATITQSGQVLGTPQYMSPEQLSGLDIDRRSDLYAVGLTLYELLAGAPPFVGTSTAQLAAQHLSDRPRPLEQLAPDTPDSLVRAIERALDKSPERRFADALEFANALDADGPPLERRDSAGRLDNATRPITGPRANPKADHKVDSREAPTIREQPAPAPATPPAPEPMAAPPPQVGEPRPSRSKLPYVVAGVLVIAVPIGVYLALHRSQAPAAPPAAPAQLVAAAPDAREPQDAPASSKVKPLLDGAEAARQAGQLDLAIKDYQDAYAIEADPLLLYRIGLLYEQLGKQPESINSYMQFIDRASASDPLRSNAMSRVAALEAAAPKPPTRHAAPIEKTGKSCHCLIGAPNDASARLCKVRESGKCRCGGLMPLCPERPGVVCTAPYSFDESVRGQQCSGYATADSQLTQGSYGCWYCAEAGVYLGERGEACKGFDPRAGNLVTGKLGECK